MLKATLTPRGSTPRGAAPPPTPPGLCAQSFCLCCCSACTYSPPAPQCIPHPVLALHAWAWGCQGLPGACPRTAGIGAAWASCVEAASCFHTWGNQVRGTDTGSAEGQWRRAGASEEELGEATGSERGVCRSPGRPLSTLLGRGGLD